jgi:putative transposase
MTDQSIAASETDAPESLRRIVWVVYGLERDHYCLNWFWDSQIGANMIHDVCWVRRPANMTRPYSLDLRERVVAAVLAGESCRTVAKRFKVSVSSVVKWSQLYRATGSVAAKQMGGNRPVVLTGATRDWLLQRIEQDADITLRGLQSELAERGVPVSYGALWNFVHREGLSFKKNRIRQRTEPA